jgi:hypothetical protein
VEGGKDNDTPTVPELVVESVEDAFILAPSGAKISRVMIRLQKHLIACMLSIILR